MLQILEGLFRPGAKKEEILKFIYLTAVFMLVIGAYTIAKELKDSVFVSLVGASYLPTAKFLVVFFLIPAAFLYALLVDSVKRYQVFSFYCLLYGLLTVAMAFLLGHPTIGLPNTDASPYRIFGWLFYFLFEGFSPYIVGVFWAFANSVSSPQDAKENYATMVAGSKIGGMAAAFFAWQMLGTLGSITWFQVSDVAAHQILLGIVAVCLLCVPILLYFMMRQVPGYYLHGYEQVYQFEKQQSKEGKASTGMLSGLMTVVTSPYLLGIFGLVLFYESLNVVLNFQRILILKEATKGIAGLTAGMFEQRLWMHAWSFILSLFGMRYVVHAIGVRMSLLVVPLLMGVAVAYFMILYNPEATTLVFILVGAVNYAFSAPLKEALYIPATKDVKFKSKAWIDSFGTKFSKSFGSLFNDFARRVAVPGSAVFLTMYSVFFSVLIATWFVTAWLLGKTYEDAVSNGKIIGAETDNK